MGVETVFPEPSVEAVLWVDHLEVVLPTQLEKYLHSPPDDWPFPEPPSCVLPSSFRNREGVQSLALDIN